MSERAVSPGAVAKAKGVAPAGRACRVSVILPIYNVETYVEECLRSVLGQDLADLEVIVVDDASQDGSRAVVERVAGGDSRVRIVDHTENEGVGRARNTGARLARGDYLIFLDSDDRLAGPHVLGMLVSAAERTRCEVIVGSCVSLLPDGSTRPHDRLQDNLEGGMPGGATEGERAFLMALQLPGHGYLPARVWGTLIARAYYTRLGLDFPEARLHEDTVVTPFLYFAANGVYYEPLIAVHYREHPAGKSRTPWSAEKLRGYARLWQTMKANLARFGLQRHTGDAAVKFAEHLTWRLNGNGFAAGAHAVAIETYAALLDDARQAATGTIANGLLYHLSVVNFLPEDATARLYAELAARLPAEVLLDSVRQRLSDSGVALAFRPAAAGGALAEALSLLVALTARLQRLAAQSGQAALDLTVAEARRKALEERLQAYEGRPGAAPASGRRAS